MMRFGVGIALLFVGWLACIFLHRAWLAWRERKAARNAPPEPLDLTGLDPDIAMRLFGAILQERGFRIDSDAPNLAAMSLRATATLASLPPDTAAAILAEWRDICADVAAEYRRAHLSPPGEGLK